jgi:hypothetical protein
LVRAKSKSSVDTHFAIYYRDGKVERDNYDSNVLGMFNTLDRLSKEYSALAQSIVSNKLGYNNSTMVMFGKNEYERVNSILKLDMKFDKSLDFDSEVTIRLELEDNSIENIAKLLTDAHSAFTESGCNFSKYGLYADNNGVLVMVSNVTPQYINSGDLAKILQRAKDGEEVGGISIFIKGDRK